MPLDLDYTGGDIVADAGGEQPGAVWRPGSRRRFVRLDLTADPLPRADVVLCRDCLVHLSFDHIRQAFDNLRRSGSTWLLTTTFLEHHENVDIESGDWRILNLTRAPFNLPAPEGVLVEGCLEGDGAYADKALGLWRIADLPDDVNHRTQRHRDAQRSSWGQAVGGVSPRILCASSCLVSLWLTTVKAGASASRRRRRRSR